MSSEKTTRLLILLTFVGMVGIYVGAYIAWQKYQTYQQTYQQSGGGLAGILNLLTSKSS